MCSANRLTSGLEAFFSAVLPRSTSAIPSWIALARNWVSGPAGGCGSSARAPVAARARRARLTAAVLMTSSPRFFRTCRGSRHPVGPRGRRCPAPRLATGYETVGSAAPLRRRLRALRGDRHADVLPAAVLEGQRAGEGLPLLQGLGRLEQHEVVAARRQHERLVGRDGDRLY